MHAQANQLVITVYQFLLRLLSLLPSLDPSCSCRLVHIDADSRGWESITRTHMTGGRSLSQLHLNPATEMPLAEATPSQETGSPVA